MLHGYSLNCFVFFPYCNGNHIICLFKMYFISFAEIEKVLNDIGKSIKDFSGLPPPSDIFLCRDVNRLINEETSYYISEMKQLHEANFLKLNSEQREVYHSVIDSVEKNLGRLIFVHGSGSCGKTFLWQTLCSRLRLERKIVLPVASSGIAAVFLPGGKTAQ